MQEFSTALDEKHYNFKVQLLTKVNTDNSETAVHVKQLLDPNTPQRYVQRNAKGVPQDLSNHNDRVNKHIRQYMIQTDKLISVLNAQLQRQVQLNKTLKAMAVKNWKDNCPAGAKIFGAHQATPATELAEQVEAEIPL
jgi:predicted ABC-class ATPase